MWIHSLSVIFLAIAVVVSLTPYLGNIWRMAEKITSGYPTRRAGPESLLKVANQIWQFCYSYDYHENSALNAMYGLFVITALK